jgi:hypothetical protein
MNDAIALGKFRRILRPTARLEFGLNSCRLDPALGGREVTRLGRLGKARTNEV